MFLLAVEDFISSPSVSSHFQTFGEFGSLASFYFSRRVSFGDSDVTKRDSGSPRGVEREETPLESNF